MAVRDYYQVLGVSRTASEKEVRQAFRRLARQHHPDVNPGNKTAEERFKLINEAYEVLSDPEKRRKYDRYGNDWRHADRIEEAQRQGGSRWEGGGPRAASSPNDLFGDDFGSVFGSMFGGRSPFSGARGGAWTEQREDVEHPIAISLEEAFHGATRTIEFTRQDACPVCGGGGRVGRSLCYQCRGAGAVSTPRRLEVKVPPGVDTGSRVRVAGEGPNRSDLYLVVSVQPHPRLERKGADLYVDVEVPLVDALLGGEVEVQGIKGKVLLTIPPETQNGRVFRLAGQGMPRLDGSGRGDLYARVKVVLPQQLSTQERELVQKLRTLRGRR